MIHSKKSIQTALAEASKTFQKLFSEEELRAKNQPEGWFVTPTAAGKWTPGQHLDHLIKSVEPLNLAYRWVPKMVLRFWFGKPNRAGRSFDELVEKYHARLVVANPVNNPFSSKFVAAEQRPKLLQRFDNQYVTLGRLVENWSEAELDAYLLPHPLLGKLTLREMLFFTVYHIGHHRAILER